MKWVPFTLHMKILPNISGKRFENWRDMQKIAEQVYLALETLAPDTINIAIPGGGQQRSYCGFSSTVNGTAVKPQFGDTPAQLQITGFNKSESKNYQPHPDLMRIHAGEVMTGPNQHSWETGPSTTVDDEVRQLKSQIEAAVIANVPSDMIVKIFRIDYSGITYGDRGYHFP